jgi:hypothetical protein
LILKKVAYSNLDNAATIGLAICFDIPAVILFSMTTLMVEEIVFRGYYYARLTQTRSIAWSVVISSVVWTLFKAPELLDSETFDIVVALSLLFSNFSLGMMAAVLFCWLESVWPAYLFRVGITIFPPAILGNFAQNSDFFFESKAPWFHAEGLVFSILLLTTALFVYFYKIRKKLILSEAGHLEQTENVLAKTSRKHLS